MSDQGAHLRNDDFIHAEASSINSNSGPGSQRNHGQYSGSQNRQYNAEHMAFNETHLVQERAETLPMPSSSVPFRRDSDYIDREALTTQMHAKLSMPAGRAALVGLGGVGKSQLAIEYSYRLREQSPDTWVLWIHASNAARFEQSLREVAELVKIRGREEAKTEIFKLVQAWLRDKRKGRWLVVLDNVDDASFLLQPPVATEDMQWKRRIDYFPVCDHGSILITSRSTSEARKIAELADIITVGSMTANDAVLLLEKKLGPRREKTDIADLAETLEFVPLAMTQAASYIAQRGRRYPLQRYLKELRKSGRSKESVLDSAVYDHRRDEDARNAIFTTWQISFEHVYRVRRSAADLLSVMSFCDRQAIPEQLVRRRERREATTAEERKSRDAGEEAAGDGDLDCGNDSNSSHSSSERLQDDDFDIDIAMLEGYSFVSVTADVSVFEMHRLVQYATQRWLSLKDLLEGYKEQLTNRLCDVFPTAEYENWHVCQRLFTHARSIMQQPPQRQKSMLQWASVMYNAAWYALTQGNTTDALEMSSLSMKVREERLGNDSAETLESMELLAITLQTQEKYEAAEQMSWRVVEGSKKVLGKEHPHTINSISNLAIVLWKQEKYEEAEQMNRQALEVCERVLGEEHPDTLTSVDNLALVLLSRENYEAAEQMSRRALQGREKVLGMEHPDTLLSVSNLSALLLGQEKYEAAEQMNQRAIEGREKVLGNEHPDTLTSVSNLVSVLWKQEKYEAAEQMNRRALEGREKVLGKEHFDTLVNVRNLAHSYYLKNDFAAALPLYRRAYAGYAKILGPTHPTTKSCEADMEALQDLDRVCT